MFRQIGSFFRKTISDRKTMEYEEERYFKLPTRGAVVHIVRNNVVVPRGNTKGEEALQAQLCGSRYEN